MDLKLSIWKSYLTLLIKPIFLTFSYAIFLHKFRITLLFVILESLILQENKGFFTSVGDINVLPFLPHDSHLE